MTGDRVMAECWLHGAIARLQLLRAALEPADATLPQDGMLEVLGDTLDDLERLRAIIVPDAPPCAEAGTGARA